MAFVLAFFACGKSIQSVFVKWEESFAEKSTPIWDIPFPGTITARFFTLSLCYFTVYFVSIFHLAVTICPETKAMYDLNFTYVFHEMASKLKYPYNITDEE